MNEIDASGFKPTHGLIIVESGSLQDIHAAISEYAELHENEEVPGRFSVEIHPQSDGTTAVIAPGGLPAFDFSNMTVWLSAPPNQSKVGGASSWLISPGDGEEYYLEPELENEWGDTMIGASRNGRKVRVLVPDAGLAVAEHRVGFKERPILQLAASPVTVDMTLDMTMEFGNPNLVLNIAGD